MDKYFIGLDVGSNSVGWAVTDEDFNLKRLKGKTAWGARLFDKANTAETRRMHRSSGRRLARRRFRLMCLRELFEPIINKVDPNFFNRLSESAYQAEDKTDPRFIHPLFGSEQDKEFHKKYKTIWHLRKKLMEGDAEALSDIRNVYLAIHHIVKYRGNFLNPDESMEIGSFDAESVAKSLNEYFSSKLEDEEEALVFVEKEDIDNFLDVLKNANLGKADRKREGKKLFGRMFSEFPKEGNLFVSLAVSQEGTISYEESDEKIKVSFGKDYEDKVGEYQSSLGEDFALVAAAKSISDYIELNEILGGESSISSAFVSLYECHRQQLRALKDICIHIDEDKGVKEEKDRLYYLVFKNEDPSKANYFNLINNRRKTSLEEFNKFIADHVLSEGIRKEDEAIANCLGSFVNNKTLLKTIAISSTSVIPHQLHKKELEAILLNAEKRYPEIKSIHQKIIDTFMYRIPYYYGPLSPNHTEAYKGGVVFKQEAKKEPLRPWNYKEKIDEAATRSNFMNSLTNTCQYLPGENVLPRQSILFMDFVMLNRLNTLRINGHQIEQSVKLDVFENLLKTHKQTTPNQLKRYLEKHFYTKDGAVISGINEKDNFDNSTRFSLSGVFDVEGEAEKVERIIYLMAIYTDEKRDAIEAIKQEYDINEKQEKALMALQVKGWSTLSKKLLKGYLGEDDNGETYSIIGLLTDTTLSFNEILNDGDYHFSEKIEELKKEYYQDKTKKEVMDEILDSIPAPMRRATIQAVRIVDEVAKISKHAPSVISLEVTREGKKAIKGKETISRKKTIDDFVKNLSKESEDKKLSEELSAELRKLSDLMALKRKDLYLYFMQGGRDLYTGKRIDINDILSNEGKYNIDHIYPQSKIKDDSLDNLALVNTEYNQKVKKDLYPLPIEIRNNPDVINLWKRLLKRKGISNEKYNRLMRASELTDLELADFVNAQINVVNYANKAIRDVIKAKYPETEVIYSKAEYPAQLRKELEIYKIRELNDAHHAVDAYLNVVCGKLLHDRFSSLRTRKAIEESGDKVLSYNMNRYLSQKTLLKDGKPTELGEKIIRISCRTDFLLTNRVSYSDAEFYDSLGVKHDLNLTPYHTKEDSPYNNVEKYGGYNSLTSEYMVVASVLEKKSYKYLLRVPHLFVSLYGDNSQQLADKLCNDFKSNNPAVKDIAIDCEHPIRNGQKIEIGHCRLLLSNSNEAKVAIRPFDLVTLPRSQNTYLYWAFYVLEKLNEDDRDFYPFATDKAGKHIHEISTEKNEGLLDSLITIASKPKYDVLAGNIEAIRKFSSEEKKAEFRQMNLKDQILLLKSIIVALNKTPILSSLIASDCRKTRKAIFDNDVYLILDSVTGLYSKKVKL